MASGLGFGPQDWNLGLETGIWASRLGSEGGGTEKEEKEEETKKESYMVESRVQDLDVRVKCIMGKSMYESEGGHVGGDGGG